MMTAGCHQSHLRLKLILSGVVSRCMFSVMIITPRTCTKGKVIGHVVVVIVVHKKSPDLGI